MLNEAHGKIIGEDVTAHHRHGPCVFYQKGFSRLGVDEFAKKKAPKPKETARQVALLLESATSLILIHGDKRHSDAAADAAKPLVKNRKPSDDRINISCARL